MVMMVMMMMMMADDGDLMQHVVRFFRRLSSQSQCVFAVRVVSGLETQTPPSSSSVVIVRSSAASVGRWISHRVQFCSRSLCSRRLMIALTSTTTVAFSAAASSWQKVCMRVQAAELPCELFRFSSPALLPLRQRALGFSFARLACRALFLEDSF